MITNEVYETIDELLGDKDKRFFSSGFKNVKHLFNDISISPCRNELTAKCSAIYPENWSVKEDGTVLKPHVSTLDILVFVFCLNKLFVSHIYQLKNNQIGNMWIKKVVIKAGSEPEYKLEDIDIHTRFLGTAETGNDRYNSMFSNEIAGFNMVIELEHDINSMTTEEIYYSSINDAGSAITGYCSQLVEKNKIYDLTNICIDKNSQSLSSNVNIRKMETISDNNIYSIIDLFACASQQMQALIYRVDSIERKCSNNLWMRKVEIEYKKPVSTLKSFRQTVYISKSKILHMKENTWRIADFKCIVDSPSNPLSVSVSLAHEIPELVINSGHKKVS
ncbi:AvrD family protein [Clostridium sp. BNL1100]|uniref:AvrD family protein n=1 Tax=Clostridium sp. BNL1100 TaxID=755731 RepID=UPI00024A7191|nr:AvrD family protein [Clostridium sp. BNL1100]AEY66774.1 avirulence D protein (AvrD) [Clostridium sp. BNL1100]